MLLKVKAELVCSSLAICICLTNGLGRDKRSLVYNSASKLQLIFGTGLPIHLHNYAATIGWIMKSAYKVPENATIYSDPYMIVHRKRSISLQATRDRYDVYDIFNSLAPFRTGKKDCLLRAICETSSYPLAAKSLVGQIISVFLRPSYTEETPKSAEDIRYHNAEQHGVDNEVAFCRARYDCDFNLLDMLTVVL